MSWNKNNTQLQINTWTKLYSLLPYLHTLLRKSIAVLTFFASFVRSTVPNLYRPKLPSVSLIPSSAVTGILSQSSKERKAPIAYNGELNSPSWISYFAREVLTAISGLNFFTDRWRKSERKSTLPWLLFRRNTLHFRTAISSCHSTPCLHHIH